MYEWRMNNKLMRDVSIFLLANTQGIVGLERRLANRIWGLEHT